MKFDIDRNTTISLIRQIHDSITEKIHSGELQNGDLLPSIRALARQIEVSMVTVSKAYNALEKEGLITTVKGKGTFIRKNTESKEKGTVREDRGNRFDWLEEIPDYLPGSLLLRPEEKTASYDFAVSDLHPSFFPVASQIQKWDRDAEESSVFQNSSDLQGDAALRNQLAAFFQASGTHMLPDEIMLTNGIQHAVDLVCRTFIGPGDVVMVESPSNPAALALFRSRGAVVLPVPVDDNGMQTEKLEVLCEKIRPKLIYTNPSFQNPTGVVLSEERREKLVRIAQTYKSIVVEEDACSELDFHSPTPQTLKSLDKGGNVIYIKGWKLFDSSGLKAGALAANKGLLRRLLISAQLSGFSSAAVPQKALLYFMNVDGKTAMEEVKKALEFRCKRVLELLTEHAPKGVTWTSPDGGLHLWIACPSWLNTDHFYQYAASRGIYIMPGSNCYPAEPEYSRFRICFSNLEERQLEEGITALCELLYTVIYKCKNNWFLSY